ncbi:MAG: O-antigen ligase family protein [Mucilaginibacter polytrichastri]|nr:O-antigen ligase family protein [Mucilaginibacter polytrichastri]
MIARLLKYVQTDFLQKKLNSPLGILLIAALAGVIGFAASKGLMVSIIAIAAAMGLFVAFLCFTNEAFGIVLIIVLAHVTATLGRAVVSLPYGSLIEALIVLVFLGVMIRKTLLERRSLNISQDAIAIALLILLGYQALQVFNPGLANKMGYFNVLKRSTIMFLFYIICTYSFSTYKNLSLALKVWIGLCFLLGLHGCYQEWVGLLPFEKRWLYGPEVILTLFLVDGHLRKFSLLDSPTNFGLLMATMGAFLLILLTGKYNFRKKLILIVMIAAMLLGMAFSGTRTAYVMLPAGLGLFFIMNINKISTIIIGVVCALGMAFVLYGPIKEKNIDRIRSAFNPGEDASYNVRDINRAKIQPVIHSHPFGTGITTMGSAGLKFNPNSGIAGFPPDSEYVKSAVETGYVGYFVYLAFYAAVLITTVNRFFSCRDRNIQVLYAAIAAAFFTMILGNYSQETANMFPNDVYLYLLLAFSASLYKFDSSYPDSYKTKPYEM